MRKHRIMGNALLWAAIIAATALTLRNTAYLQEVLPVLGGGAAVSFLLNLGSDKANKR